MGFKALVYFKIRGDDKDQTLSKADLLHVLFIVIGTVCDDEIQLAQVQQMLCIQSVEVPHSEVNVWVLPMKLNQMPGDEVIHAKVAAADGQVTSLQCARLLDQFPEALLDAMNLLQRLNVLHAKGRQPYRVVRAVEDRKPKLFLRLPDHDAQRGLRDEELVRSLAEASLAVYGVDVIRVVKHA